VAEPSSLGERPPLGASELGNPLLRFVLWVLDPEDNPTSVVYGLLTVGTVIAVESARSVDIAAEIEAVVLIIFLYWLAHAYASLLGRRLSSGSTISVRTIGQALRREWALVRGATVPVVIMLLTWMLGWSISAIEWSGIISAIVLLVLFEVAAGLRSHLPPLGVVVQGLVGVTFGLTLLVVRALLV